MHPNGFVFGKYLPLHKGHEALIRFALQRCERVLAIVCCSDREAVEPAVRKNWLEAAFADEPRLSVRTFSYLESELPNTSISSKEVSETWARAFEKMVPEGCSALVTSEPYGDFVAAAMGIDHLPFDLARRQFPISSSAVQRDLFEGWPYLADSAKPFFSLKITLLGTESTGKSTLSERLAARFGASFVPEAARDLIESSDRVDFDDLPKIAEAQLSGIEAAMKGPSPLVVSDTDALTTMSYACFLFSKKLELDEHRLRATEAGLYLYSDASAPFVQDGTRLGEADRNRLDASHRAILKERGLVFEELKGSYEARFGQAARSIEAFVERGRRFSLRR